MGSPGKNTRVGCHFLLQGIFPTQGLNPGLLHCRQILYHLSYREVPKFEEENGNPLQYSCLENSTDRGAWWAIVHGVETHPHEHTLLLTSQGCLWDSGGKMGPRALAIVEDGWNQKDWALRSLFCVFRCGWYGRNPGAMVTSVGLWGCWCPSCPTGKWTTLLYREFCKGGRREGDV